MSDVKGKTLESRLPLGGFGLSRYSFDQYLVQLALSRGCQLLQENVLDVSAEAWGSVVRTDQNEYRAKLVFGAYGKRSQLDRQLDRPFFRRKSPWMAIKSHYSGSFADDLVALHNFPGGYCGVSKVEDNRINICYLVNYESFKAYRNIDEHRKAVLYQNPFLKEILEKSESLFQAPLSISQVSFKKKEKAARKMLMVGDSAGLIHPLCGNGMSMAIHAAMIASSLAIDYLNRRIETRAELQRRYEKAWSSNFNFRIGLGHMLSSVLHREKAAAMLMSGLMSAPPLLKKIIQGTHGKPFNLA